MYLILKIKYPYLAVAIIFWDIKIVIPFYLLIQELLLSRTLLFSVN